MEISNAQVAKIFRNVAASYTIKGIGNIFQIRAYQAAADSIEHSSAEIFDLWQEGKLADIPTLGEKIRGYIDELFKTGKVEHFKEVEEGISGVVFELLDIPGVGPKTAQNIAKLGVISIDDLKRQIKSGELVNKGFSGKIAQKIMDGIRQLSSRGGRMLLPFAITQAQKILEYLKKSPDVIVANFLGSLRRQSATIGDLDFAVSSKTPQKVIDYFVRFPNSLRVVDQGENKATIILQSGIQSDLLVGDPDSYGALLQHFTGSKNHNIHLRTLAQEKGLSLSEHTPAKTEEEFYKLLNMDIPPPEIREDTGEIEAAIKHDLPKLVEMSDIKGDLHLHSNFPLEPSHGPGVNSIEEIIKSAQSLGYEYVGISDHSPAVSTHTPEQIIQLIKTRTKFIQAIKEKTKSIRVQHAELNTSGVHILNGLEIDIQMDGSLSVPEEALKDLDFCIAGIHSGHRGSKEEITKRLIGALQSPYVDIISHPSNRLLNERESSDIDWEQVFKLAAKNKKVLEINAFPNRLDLREDLVREGLKYGVKFIIDTDAHEVSQMVNMPFGVAVARRGWASKADIVNAVGWTKFSEWFKINPW